MRKKLILGFLGLALVGAGIAVFAANTAQWVNVTARVEKEIEIACVVLPEVPGTVNTTHVVDPDGCAYGVTFPENVHDKLIEVTLSNSFENQDEKSDVFYWVLWECKLQDEHALPHLDNLVTNNNLVTNVCREDIPDDTLWFDPTHGKWVHRDPLKLDGNIRDFIDVQPSSPACLSTYTGPTGGPGKLSGLGDGVVDKVTGSKCFYTLSFNPPACEGHVNLLTDPDPHPKTIKCHEVTDSPDPQDWDRFANLGDNFKIQVFGFSPDLEKDEFPDSKLTMTVETPTGEQVPVTATGPTVVHVDLSTLGNGDPDDDDVSDECPSPGLPDGPNGLDEVQTEIVQMSLTGGGITVRLNPSMPSMGQIEENVNNTPDQLDLPPFTAVGTACSFFEIHVEVEIPGVGTLHNQDPIRVESEITEKPPAVDDPEYCDDSTVPLFDEGGNPSGFSIIGVHCHDPVPPPIG